MLYEGPFRSFSSSTYPPEHIRAPIEPNWIKPSLDPERWLSSSEKLKPDIASSDVIREKERTELTNVHMSLILLKLTLNSGEQLFRTIKSPGEKNSYNKFPTGVDILFRATKVFTIFIFKGLT